MKVHVFGNSPSPAVAIYGFRQAAKDGEHKHGSDTRRFIKRHFYVDNGIVSLPTDAEAISLLQRTQISLAKSNLRLHKIASLRNESFPSTGSCEKHKGLGSQWRNHSNTAKSWHVLGNGHRYFHLCNVSQ